MKTNKIIEKEGRFYVTGKDGKGNLGKKDGYATKEEAEKRLREIEFFKTQGNRVNVQLCTNVDKSQIEETTDSFLIRKIPMMVDDAIMNGLKYRKNDNAQGLKTFVNKQVTLGHPMENNAYVSASHGPAMMNYFSGGYISNTYNINGVNYADIEIKKRTLKAQDADDGFFYNQLETKQPIGVSTGLYLETEIANETDDFDGYAVNQVGDHLAMLHSSEPPAGGDATFMRFNSEDSTTADIVVNVDEIIKLKQSANEKRSMLESAIYDFYKTSMGTKEYYVWVRDFDDDSVIFSFDDKMNIASYMIDAIGNVSLSDISEVKEKSVFEKVKSTFLGAVNKIFDGQNNDSHNKREDSLNNNEDTSMRQAYIDALTKAGIKVNEDASDADVLSQYQELSANKLKGMVDEAMQPFTQKLDVIGNKLQANEDAAKADLVAKAVAFGINEEDAKQMSVNALQAIADKVGSGNMQTNGVNGQYQPNNQQDSYTAEMPK